MSENITRHEELWMLSSVCTSLQSDYSVTAACLKNPWMFGYLQPIQQRLIRVCFFVLRFFCPVNPMGSCWVQSVYLTTLLLGRLSPLSSKPVLCAFIARNWQLPFLNQRKGENDSRKYFMINLHERMLPTRCGSNPQPPDHQSGCACNWAIEADQCLHSVHMPNSTFSHVVTQIP